MIDKLQMHFYLENNFSLLIFQINLIYLLIFQMGTQIHSLQL